MATTHTMPAPVLDTIACAADRLLRTSKAERAAREAYLSSQADPDALRAWVAACRNLAEDSTLYLPIITQACEREGVRV